MSKVKTLIILSCGLILLLGQLLQAGSTHPQIRQSPVLREFSSPLNSLSAIPSPHRDQPDNLWTYRFMVSRDGGDHWSNIMGVGDPGMYKIRGEGEQADTISVLGPASFNFGAIAGINRGRLHFIAILNAFNPDYNPLNRLDGIYDVRTDRDANTEYILIAEEQNNDEFIWADAGISVNGVLYALWVKLVSPQQGDPYCELWASISTDYGDQWSNPVRLLSDLPSTFFYPHMTYNVGAYFWIIYQLENPETHYFDHWTVKISADLSEVGAPLETGASSNRSFSYSKGAVNPIDQDVAAGWVYFTVVHDYGVDTQVGYMQVDGEEWNIDTIPGSSTSPSIILAHDMNQGVPWVLNSFEPPAPGAYQFNWYSYDGGGYGGGNWLDPIPLDSSLYDGVRTLLGWHRGIITPDGRLITGASLVGQYSPEGLQVRTSDNFGESWNELVRFWSIFDEPHALRGGSVAPAQFLAGLNNSVWVAFCGQYGETDFTPPTAAIQGLSSFTIGESWLVTAEINDNVSAIEYADIGFGFGPPLAPEAVWAYAPADSNHADAMGSGQYYFTLPSREILGQALEPQDTVWFFIFAQDEGGNGGYSREGRIIANEGFTSVNRSVLLPEQLTLGPGYPNPFNALTTLPFNLNRTGRVKISIYDVQGRLVENLLNRITEAGRHLVIWNGNSAPAGIYLCVLETAGQKRMVKLTLLR